MQASDTKAKWEEEAAQWKAGSLLIRPDNLHAAVLKLWLPTHQPAASETLKAYAEAVAASIEGEKGPNWYDDFMCTRSYCAVCGERYRVENLGLCALPGCGAMICSDHGPSCCPVCGQGEIIG